MTQAEERRAQGPGRVTVETLVEVCGNEPGIPSFEAESIDVSARGMHLRTAYLPEQGAPLVCRFEERGREIVVEGVVAWRRESARGGEFGVEFTALDGRSVDALRELCHAEGEEERAAGEREAVPAHASGSRVRLHIDGLGSPMKARVRSGDPRRVQVGSNLEFLKVGRRLEIEDLERGGRRTAQIDSVNVAIDPESNIPQLVVALRYEGAEETTPEPSALDLGGAVKPAKVRRISTDALTTDAPRKSSPDGQIEDASDREVEALRGRLGFAATQAGNAVVSASKKVAALSSSAAAGVASFFRGASVKLPRREKTPPRRTTAPAPQKPGSSEGKRLRPQTSADAQPVEVGGSRLAAGARSLSALPLKKKALLGGGVAATLVCVLALGMSSKSEPPGAKLPLPIAPQPAVAAAPVAPSPLGAPAAVLPATAVTANVPLFGPTTMATIEPAPLAPPPLPQSASLEASEREAAKNSLVPAAADESFPGEEDDGQKASGKSEKSASKPEDVAPWGRGKLLTPTVHRLRLDGRGEAIQGSFQPSGFTVVVPHRKVMEAAAGLAKHDPRIARVRSVNTPNGAQVTFQFKDGVPPYRVRLRRDFVEFLISSPEPKKAAAKSETKKTSALSTAKKSERSLPTSLPAAASKSKSSH